MLRCAARRPPGPERLGRADLVDLRGRHPGQAGHQPGMSTPSESSGLAATASESPEESVQHEREAVGDQPDTGGLVPPDDAQSAPEAD